MLHRTQYIGGRRTLNKWHWCRRWDGKYSPFFFFFFVIKMLQTLSDQKPFLERVLFFLKTASGSCTKSTANIIKKKNGIFSPPVCVPIYFFSKKNKTTKEIVGSTPTPPLSHPGMSLINYVFCLCCNPLSLFRSQKKRKTYPRFFPLIFSLLLISTPSLICFRRGCWLLTLFRFLVCLFFLQRKKKKERFIR